MSDDVSNVSDAMLALGYSLNPDGSLDIIGMATLQLEAVKEMFSLNIEGWEFFRDVIVNSAEVMKNLIDQEIVELKKNNDPLAGPS